MKIDLVQLLRDDAIGISDKSGSTELEIWLSNNLGTSVGSNVLERDILRFIEGSASEPLKRWSTIERLIASLSLKSNGIASAIQKALEEAQPSNPFEVYCAWKAVIRLGGAFSPKILSDQVSGLRDTSPGLWLDLALIAFSASAEELRVEIEKLVAEEKISFDEFEERYESCSEIFGASTTNVMIRKLSENLPDTEFRQSFREWMAEELGMQGLPLHPAASPNEDNDREGNVGLQDQVFGLLENFRLSGRSFSSATS